MKKRTFHIIYSWLLLLCFIAGQCMVYTHQHNQAKNLQASFHQNFKNSSHSLIKEKCELCDSMHLTAMELPNTAAYHATLLSTSRVLKLAIYAFISNAPILAAGRAPPLVS